MILNIMQYSICIFLLLALLFPNSVHTAIAAPASIENASNSCLLQEKAIQDESVTITSSFPVINGQSGSIFEFDFQILYEGKDIRVFEIDAVPPEGWSASIKRKFYPGESSIRAVRINPEAQYPEQLTAFLSPPGGTLPEQGKYPIMLEAKSGPLTDSMELKAIVDKMPADNEIDMMTATGRLDAEVKAGEDNHFGLILTNKGDQAVESISFRGVKSDGWEVSFEPSTLDVLNTGQSEHITVNIKPPKKTIAGDYNVLLRSMSSNVSDQLSMRIRVKTDASWGWISGGIVAAIISVIVVVFRRLGRR